MQGGFDSRSGRGGHPAVIREHFARTGAVEMENTHNRCGGTVWPLEAMQAVGQLARSRGVGVHLDGARIWNAHKATGVSLKAYAATADSVSVCFSKGLGLRWARLFWARGSS